VRLDDVRGFVLDVDGTLVHRAGDDVHVIPGAGDVLARIRASGRPLALFTNGSHIPPAGFAAGLRDAGLDVADEELLTPLSSALTYLRAHHGAALLLFGTAAARAYLVENGIRIVDGDGPEHADAVLVVHPDVADFGELERGARAILGGARLLTGSYVPAYAGANGPIFSRGAMLTAALAKASGATPIVVGKPSLAALDTVLEQVGVPPEHIAVVGDDATMDVALGRLGGCTTVLVRSGISGQVEVERLDESQRPDAVVDGVAELLEWL